MVRLFLLIGLFGFTLVSGTGCRLFGCRPLCDWGRDRDRAPSRSGDGFLREPSATDPYIAPTRVPAPGSVSDLPQPDISNSRSNRFADPLNPKRELLLPEDLPGTASPNTRSGSGFLESPQSSGDERESKKVNDTNDGNGFSRVKPGVATGRVPSANTLDRLKKASFKTVAYLHAPGADTSSVRRDVEAKGLTFVGVPVSAEKLPEAMRAFNDAVADKSSRPIYLCDEDGVRTGSLWYLYFRTVEFANDDSARLLAAPLGLTEPPSSEQTTFWVAMRNYLATR